jgi:hypothetical protein
VTWPAYYANRRPAPARKITQKVGTQAAPDAASDYGPSPDIEVPLYGLFISVWNDPEHILFHMEQFDPI